MKDKKAGDLFKCGDLMSDTPGPPSDAAKGAPPVLRRAPRVTKAEPYALRFSEAEIAAGLKHPNSAWVAQDAAARSFMKKLREAAPHVCEYCFNDGRVGTHSMAQCTNAAGERVKRG